MIRTLKALGLAVVAVLAMSAVAAAGAQAETVPTFTGFDTGPEGEHIHTHTLITGEKASAHIFTPGEGFGEVTCEEAHFHGTSETGTDTTLTIEPTYGECHAKLPGGTIKPAHVRLNGCHYLFHVATKVETDHYTGTVDIVGCETGKEIEVEITETPGIAGHCLDTIGEQTGVGPVDFENMTGASPTDVTVNSTANNVHNTTHQGLLDCGIAKGEHTEGTYEGNTTVRGFNTEEEQIDVEVSDRVIE